MIKNACVLVSLIFAVSVGFSAEKSLKDLEAATGAVNAKNNQFAQDLATLAKQQTEAAKKVQALQKDFDVASNQWKDTAGGIFGIGRGAGDRELKKKMDDAKEKLDAAKKTAGELDDKAESLNRDKVKLLQESGKEIYDLKSQNKAITTAITTQGLLTEFATLHGKVGDTDMALEKVSNAYDKSLIGAYLKDKFGLLLNSQTMCEGVARCRVPERKEVSAETIQKTLFPGTENSTRKGNLYDKSHGSSSENGTAK
ncbi:MAG: hypothetical protein JSU04_01485 [Bdellovibrionales bacterium]|nr:hypothetical protein [Bdellovibrionales bacterium]